jgi:hypothetical protein
MADSPHKVIEFLRDLAARARPFAEQDLADLRDFARDTLALATRSPGICPTSARNSRKRDLRSANRK